MIPINKKRGHFVLSRSSLMRQTKGSHVGIVLSLVIFISFIIFVYAIARPAIFSESKRGFVDRIKFEIVYNFKIHYGNCILYLILNQLLR